MCYIMICYATLHYFTPYYTTSHYFTLYYTLNTLSIHTQYYPYPHNHILTNTSTTNNHAIQYTITHTKPTTHFISIHTLQPPLNPNPLSHAVSLSVSSSAPPV